MYLVPISRPVPVLHSSSPIPSQGFEFVRFRPGFLSQSTIFSVYGLSSLLVVSLLRFLSGRLPKLQKADRLLMCWWLFTGLNHMILEGKEYSKGDSRYAARDSGVVAVEGITAVLEGLACLLAVYAIATRKSYSYILQVVISLGQLYGTAVYYITSYLEGDNFAASLYYYYAYFIIANASWVVIPTLIVIRCWKKICAAFPVQDKMKIKILNEEFFDCHFKIWILLGRGKIFG
ncbi:hypothetical protein ACSBR2_014001 [Camellia fascicularis]